jgi:Bax protein
MQNWLNAVKIRCNTILFYWHQRHAFVYLSALALLSISGSGRDVLTLHTPSSIHFPIVFSHGNPPFVSQTSHKNLQKLRIERYFLHDQSPPSLTATQAFHFPLQANHPLITGTSPPVTTSLPSHFPDNLDELGSDERKKLFIDLLLPMVKVALEEVKQERQQLLMIISDLGGISENLYFSENNPIWQQQLGADKSKFILTLTRKYKTENAANLIGKVNILPPSLIIAQGAIESGWGSSRCAVEVNNLFGMYSSLINNQSSPQDGGKLPKAMAYESILDSVRSYVLNINTLSAYTKLRHIRSQTLDPMRIANGLTQYSARKECYIADIKQIIACNKLQHFDTLILDAV